MKKYCKPAIEMRSMQALNAIMVTSITIDDSEVPGSSALSKKNIWNDDEDF